MAADLIRAALLYRSGPHRDFPLSDAPEAVLGFSKESALRVPMEGVSRRHAKITFDGKDYWIEDAGSSNGTFVNGVRLRKRERLKHLDVVTLGRSTDLIFFLRARESARVARTGITSAAIEAVDGGDAGTRWPVPRGHITIGRAASNNVVVDSQLISKVHVRLECTGAQLVLTDLQSHNGTYLEGEKLVEPRVLKSGDEFVLGGARRFRVHLEEGTIEASGVGPLPLRASSDVALPTDWKTRLEWTPEELASLEKGRRGVHPAETALGAPEIRPAPPPAKPAAAKREPAAPKVAEAKPSVAAKPEGKPAAAAPAKPAAEVKVRAAEAKPSVAAKPESKPAAAAPAQPAEVKVRAAEAKPSVAAKPESKPVAAAPAEVKPSAAEAKPAAPPAVAPQKSAASAPVAPPAPAEASPSAPPKLQVEPPPAAPEPAEPPPAPPPVSRPVAAEPKKPDSRSTLPPQAPPAAPPVPPPLPKNRVRISGEATRALVQDEASKSRVYLEGEAETFPLPVGNHEVGRISGMSIRLDAHEVSRRHAVLHVSNAEVVVEDLGSHNGTFVNGERITAPRKLSPGDLLTFGDVQFRVRFPVEPGAPRKPE